MFVDSMHDHFKKIVVCGTSVYQGDERSTVDCYNTTLMLQGEMFIDWVCRVDNYSLGTVFEKTQHGGAELQSMLSENRFGFMRDLNQMIGQISANLLSGPRLQCVHAAYPREIETNLIPFPTLNNV